MNFKITSHKYENTGGHCMVSFDQIWLPDENRTIFATTNEVGSCFYTADVYFGGIDDLEPFEWLSVECDANIKDHRYYELFRELLHLFAIDDWKYSHNTTGLPYVLLTDELQEQVSDHYKHWCENEERIDFETDGEKIVIDANYIPMGEIPPLSDETYLKLVSTMHAFRDVYFDICKLWNSTTHIFDEVLEDYPFDISFDELHIPRWVEAVLIEAAKNRYKE